MDTPKWYDRLISGRAAALTFLAFTVLSIAWFQLGPAATLTQTGIPLLDTQVGYAPDHLYEQLEGYGEIGRSQYVLFLIGDFFWILFFAIAMAIILLLALRRVGRGAGAWGWIVFAPFAVAAFDWLENTSLLVATLRYPARTDSLAAAAPIVTSAKNLTLNVTLVLLVVAVLAIAVSYALRLRRAAA